MTENPYAVTADEAGDAIAYAASTFFQGGPYMPIMLHGDPGVGKTQGVDAAARATKAALNVQHLADREPTEIGGIYWERNGEMVRLSPQDLPMQDDVPTILFYDETPQAAMMNKNILARLVLDRKIGDFRLGNKVYVCLAGNYAHNRAGTSPMPSHLNARLSHLHVVPDVGKWLAWAARNDVHPFVTAFMKECSDHHHKPDPSADASPNPRSWVRVSEIEKSGISGQARKAMIVGTVGMESGVQYLNRAELFRTMPDPEEVFASPTTAPLPDNRSVLFALMSTLAALAKPANIGKIITYTNRLTGDEEYQALCIREARIRNPAITSARAYTDFALSPRGQSLA
jgi:hypothetical protein